MGAIGCDDAPLVEIDLFDFCKPFTLILPYYENPNFLFQHFALWKSLPESLIRRMSVIVVDDGSQQFPLEPLLRRYPPSDLMLLSFRFFVIEVDIRWNWLAARNIGAAAATDGWIMLTDMDHMLTAETLHTLVCGDHSPNIIYRFSRIGAKTHPHPNSWFMTKDMFWKIGGYDERMSGYYGSDGYYRRRCAATAPIKIMTVPLVCHEHEGDSSTTFYKRKQPEDAKLKPIVKAFPKGSKPLTLSFPFHEITL